MDTTPETGQAGDRKGGILHREDRISQREIELIKYRDNRTPLIVKLVTGEELEGAIRWYDDHALRLILADRSEMTIYLQAVVYYKQRI